MADKKRILFVAYGMGIGGIEKCMVNLLNTMPEERYDVDVLLLTMEHDLRPQVKKSVRFLDTFDYLLSTDFTMPEIRRRGGYWKHRHLLIPYFRHRVRVFLGRFVQFKALPWLEFKAPEREYDIAVAYSQNGVGAYYVIDKVKAAKKVLWYHNGAYERTGIGYAWDQTYYPQFDQIVAVSEDCKAMLGEKFPQLREKLLVLRNLCDVEDIRRKAGAFQPESFESKRLHIVTVGRMTVEKGAQLALEACRILREEGLDICWHWVGDGPCSPEIRKKVKRLGLEDRFLLEGNQTNPYPYIAGADIYVQPSYFEAYSTTVTEARILYRPIVATEVGGMGDQLREGQTGRIVPIDAAAIAAGIRELAQNEQLRTSFTEQLKLEDISAGNELEKYERTVFA